MLHFNFNRFLLLIALHLLFPALLQAAPKCKNPVSLSEFVARADIIAVVKLVHRHLSVDPQAAISKKRAVFVTGLEVEIQKMLKRPYVEGFDLKRSQRVRISPQRLRTNAPNRAVVFLQYRSENSWKALPCGVLPLNDAGNVYKACDSITDLFGYDRFLRERICLLSTPAIVTQSQLEKEIKRVKLHARQYQGRAEVVRVFSWSSTQPFQRVLLRFRGRAIKKLLPEKFRGSELKVMGYYPTELLTERSYKKTFRRGRRLKIKATWFEGNFVLETAAL